MPEQPGDVERTCADISKARQLLGYSPKVPFEDGIARTAEWYRAAYSQGLIAGYGEAGEHLLSGESDKSLPRPPSEAGSPRLRRDTSDLELSSYVQKASKQCRERKERVF